MKWTSFWLVVVVHLQLINFTSIAVTQVNGREYSTSASEANNRGTLINEVTIMPSLFKWKNVEVTISQAWIEKCKEGGCYLCFRIEKGKEACYSWNSDHGFFVVGDNQRSVKLHSFRDSRLLAVEYLVSSNLKDVRLSFVGGWKEERPKNFRVTQVTK